MRASIDSVLAQHCEFDAELADDLFRLFLVESWTRVDGNATIEELTDREFRILSVWMDMTVSHYGAAGARLLARDAVDIFPGVNYDSMLQFVNRRFK
jgi:hypothetical protein